MIGSSEVVSEKSSPYLFHKQFPIRFGTKAGKGFSDNMTRTTGTTLAVGRQDTCNSSETQQYRGRAPRRRSGEHQHNFSDHSSPSSKRAIRPVVAGSGIGLLRLLPFHIIFLLVLRVPQTSGQRLLLDIVDTVSKEDIDVGGECVDGCSRKVVSAVAAVAGETDCDLRVLNLLDHIDRDVEGGTLSIVHSCFDENSNLFYQVRRSSWQCVE